MSDFKHYFGLPPSDQNALDVFAGEWSSSPPASRPELKAGATPLFDDPRIQWTHDRFNEMGLAGGFTGRDVLELGPLEGAHTYLIDKLGATRVTAASLSGLSAQLSASDLSALNSQLSTPPAAGVYFRVHLGGITGHGDFARDTGLLIKPAEAVAVSAAMLRVFAENGDRTNRKKARLKYLLEKWGVEKFLDETQKKLAFPLVRLPLAACEPRRPVIKHGWLGAARQSQRGLNSLGIGVPVGRLSSKQLHTLADLATHFGTGELRLTVWQSIIIPHVADAFVETVKRSVVRLGCFHEASLAAGGIIACTGSRGCKFAAADTKAHGLSLLKHLGKHTALTSPGNPPAVPESKSGRMCGCCSAAVVVISCTNRSAPSTAASSGLSSLSATFRLCLMSSHK